MATRGDVTPSTGKVIESKMFIFTDVKNNNNKFWEYKVYDDGKVYAHWGRVGDTGDEGWWLGGSSFAAKKVREKIAKGYTEAKIVTNTSPDIKVAVKNNDLKSIAKKQIGGCPIVSQLIEYFAQVNKHQIHTASGGKIDVDLDSGVVKTALGVVTKDAIDEARSLLNTISTCVKKNDWESETFSDSLNLYLRNVPQAVGRNRGWGKAFIPTFDAIQKQNSLLDSLESSLDFAMNKNKPVDDNKPEEKVFDVKMSLVESNVFDRLNRKYIDTRKDVHVCKHLKLQKAYNLTIGKMNSAFNEHGSNMSNIQELWHATKKGNLLSILSCGLKMPNPNSFNFTGAMFSSGQNPAIYFANASTKSLNYAYGYWDGNYDDRCFMFLADVALGNYYIPPGPTSNPPPKGYDSYWAKAGKSGVANDEIVIFDLRQINIKYLLEFDK